MNVPPSSLAVRVTGMLEKGRAVWLPDALFVSDKDWPDLKPAAGKELQDLLCALNITKIGEHHANTGDV